MKVTLIYPGIASIGFNSLCKGNPSTNLTGLGLAYLGASIKEKTHHQVDLIDLREMTGWDHFTSELSSKNSRFVGIHTNTVNFDFAIKCAEISKTLKKIVIVGGPHATLAPQDLLDTGYVDHVVTGEGETTFPTVLDRIESGEEIDKVIPGEPVEDLDQIPFPDRDLYNMRRILNSQGIYPYPHRYVGIITSRGCPFNCSFCQPMERTLFGRKIRRRSVKNVIDEVVHVVDKYKANFIMFQDSTFTVNTTWILDFCHKIADLKIKWGCQTRIDALDEEVIRALKESGCTVIMFGFESGSQRILDFLKKGITCEQSLEAAKLCKKYGILIFANYMIGVPSETEKDLEETCELMREIKPEIHAPSYYSPIPGSELYEYCKQNDLLIHTKYETMVRSTFESKIKGIDYKNLELFKAKIGRWKTPWYKSKVFSSCLLSRCSGLLRAGRLIQVLKEIILLLPLTGLLKKS